MKAFCVNPINLCIIGINLVGYDLRDYLVTTVNKAYRPKLLDQFGISFLFWNEANHSMV